MAILQAQGLKKIYGSGDNAVHALDGWTGLRRARLRLTGRRFSP